MRAAEKRSTSSPAADTCVPTPFCSTPFVVVCDASVDFATSAMVKTTSFKAVSLRDWTNVSKYLEFVKSVKVGQSTKNVSQIMLRYDLHFLQSNLKRPGLTCRV